MYESRLRRLLLVFYVLLGVIGARAFSLQVLGAEYENGRSWASMAGESQEYVVHPRRGEITWADGTKMVWNVPSYALEIRWGDVDHRIVPTLDAFRAAYPRDLTPERREELKDLEEALVLRREKLFNPRGSVPPPEPQLRWRCRVCGTELSSRGPPDAPCPDCRQSEFDEAPLIDAAELAALLSTPERPVDVHQVHLALIAALGRWRMNSHWRSHSFFARIPETAVDAMDFYPQKFGGFLALPCNGREVDPLARRITGSTRLPSAEEARRLAESLASELGLESVQPETFYPTLTGASLLERAFDDELRGRPGLRETFRARENDFRREVREIRPVVDGEDLRTTLRRGLQEMAQRIVDQGAPEGGHAAAVVIDVRSGAVLALASRSSDGMDHARSHVIPGSVYKLVTAIALLDSGHAPTETLVCQGAARIEPFGRYNCHGHAHGEISLHRAFVASCNGYFAQMAVAVGADAIAAAARRLGLGDGSLNDTLPGASAQPSGLDHSSPETHPDQWNPWDVSQIGIGQGAASASPLQTAVAYARIASGGRKIVPYLLERNRPPPPEVDPVLARWSPALRDAARDVVVDDVFGTAADKPGLRRVGAAGKTGTAEVGKKKEHFLNNASFVGYAPYDDPRYCAIVVFERMEKGVYGADAAGEPVAELLAEALRE